MYQVPVITGELLRGCAIHTAKAKRRLATARRWIKQVHPPNDTPVCSACVTDVRVMVGRYFSIMVPLAEQD